MSSTLSKLAILALLVPLAACASASEPGSPAEAADGPTGHGSSNLAICGASTAASIVDADGRRLTFCVSDHGREIIAEETSDGMPSVMPRRVGNSKHDAALRADECALDVFLAHSAADVPVPVAMKTSCELRRGHAVDIGARKLSDAAVLQPTPSVTGLKPEFDVVELLNNTSASKYCDTSTGPVAFVTDFCVPLCTGTDSPCSQACTPRFWSSSVRQCPEVNVVLEDIVSCTGFTRVLVDVRDGSSDPWTNRLDTFVGPNRHVLVHVFEYGSLGADSDIRVRGASEAGATHMHAFQCIDF